jgi:hypothetical protein
MTDYELLDATEAYLVGILRREQDLKRRGIPGQGVEYVKCAIAAVRKERKCRRGHRAGE